MTCLFSKWKAFTSKKGIIYSSKKGGIVLKICNDLSDRKMHRQPDVVGQEQQSDHKESQQEKK
jgi:hypothetical protein